MFKKKSAPPPVAARPENDKNKIDKAEDALGKAGVLISVVSGTLTLIKMFSGK